MPAVVACAIVHDEPPVALVADDIDTLHWVLALQVVAQTPARVLEPHVVRELRQALIEERWGDAVEMWMAVQPGTVDVYPSYDLYGPSDVALGAQELQFTPLFSG